MDALLQKMVCEGVREGSGLEITLYEGAQLASEQSRRGFKMGKSAVVNKGNAILGYVCEIGEEAIILTPTSKHSKSRYPLGSYFVKSEAIHSYRVISE